MPTSSANPTGNSAVVCPEGSKWDGAICVASLSDDGKCPPGHDRDPASNVCWPKLLDRCEGGKRAHPRYGCQDAELAVAEIEPDSDEFGRLNSPLMNLAVGTSPARDTAGVDHAPANGNMWGDEIGEAYGSGGLGLPPKKLESGVTVVEVVSYGAAEADVRAAVVRAHERLDSCYSGGGSEQIHKVTFEAVLQLESGGRVRGATVTGGSGEFAEVRECLTRVLGELDFASAVETDVAAAGIALSLRAGTVERFALSHLGYGQPPVRPRSRVPRVRGGAVTVSGRLPPEIITRIVRQNFGRFRLCYEQGLARDITLAGKVVLRFGIARDGSLSHVSSTAGSDLPDAAVVRCVASGLNGVSFPQPESGVVSVVFPLWFEPPTPSGVRP